jgi:acyl-coenzyme A thioesterase PaaI-like protein
MPKEYIVRKLYNAKHCYVCGTDNKDGLHASFYVLSSNRLLTVYRPKKDHHGYPSILHGGIIASLLDEGMARVSQVFYDQPFGVTVKLNVDYLKKTPTDKVLYVVSEMKEDKSRIFYASAYVTDLETIYARGEASYMKVPLNSTLYDIPYEMVVDQEALEEISLPL